MTDDHDLDAPDRTGPRERFYRNLCAVLTDGRLGDDCPRDVRIFLQSAGPATRKSGRGRPETGPRPAGGDGDPGGRPNGGGAGEAEHGATAVIASDATAVAYWNWKYCYTLNRNPDGEVPSPEADDTWRRQAAGGWALPPPDRIMASEAAMLVTDLDTRHRGEIDPYRALGVERAPGALQRAIETLADLAAGLDWLEHGDPPDPDARRRVHPNRRHLKAVGGSGNRRWLRIKSTDALHRQLDAPVLGYQLDPARHATRAENLLIFHIRAPTGEETKPESGERFGPNTHHAVYHVGGPGKRTFMGVYEITGADGEPSIPGDLLKTRVELGEAALEALRTRLG